MSLIHLTRCGAVLLLFAALAACNRSPGPLVPDDPSQASAAVGSLRGVIRDGGGAPVAGADVYVGVRRVPNPQTPGACEDFAVGSGLLALVRTPTDRRGAFQQRIPTAEPPDTANCLVAFAAAQRDTVRPWNDPAAAGSRPLAVPLAQANQPVELTLQPVEGPGGWRIPDDEWAELALGPVPGFAGLFLEGCTVGVNLTNPETQSAAAREYVLGVLAERGGIASREPCPSPPPVEFRRVRYDFAQLRRWYHRATVLGSLDGWVMSDIDEVRNRIVFGFVSVAAGEQARRALGTLKVPPDAVVIEAPVPPVELR